MLQVVESVDGDMYWSREEKGWLWLRGRWNELVVTGRGWVKKGPLVAVAESGVKKGEVGLMRAACVKEVAGVSVNMAWWPILA